MKVAKGFVRILRHFFQFFFFFKFLFKIGYNGRFLNELTLSMMDLLADLLSASWQTRKLRSLESFELTVLRPWRTAILPDRNPRLGVFRKTCVGAKLKNREDQENPQESLLLQVGRGVGFH